MLPDNYIVLTKEFREIIKNFILSDDENVEYRLIVLLNYVLDPYEKIISGICSDVSNLFSEIRSMLDNENGKESSKCLKQSKEKEETRKVLINSMEAIENQMSECIDNICISYPCKLNILFKSVNEKISKHEDTDSIINSIVTGYTDIINYYVIIIGAISDTLSLRLLCHLKIIFNLINWRNKIMQNNIIQPEIKYCNSKTFWEDKFKSLARYRILDTMSINKFISEIKIKNQKNEIIKPEMRYKFENVLRNTFSPKILGKDFLFLYPIIIKYRYTSLADLNNVLNDEKFKEYIANTIINADKNRNKSDVLLELLDFILTNSGITDSVIDILKAIDEIASKLLEMKIDDDKNNSEQFIQYSDNLPEGVIIKNSNGPGFAFSNPYLENYFKNMTPSYGFDPNNVSRKTNDVYEQNLHGNIYIDPNKKFNKNNKEMTWKKLTWQEYKNSVEKDKKSFNINSSNAEKSNDNDLASIINLLVEKRNKIEVELYKNINFFPVHLNVFLTCSSVEYKDKKELVDRFIKLTSTIANLYNNTLESVIEVIDCKKEYRNDTGNI